MNDASHDEPLDRPTFPHTKGHPWQPQAKALAVRALAEARNTTDAIALLEQWADWPDRPPRPAVMRKWASEHNIALVPKHPETPAGEWAEAAREHRLLRMETARADLSELLIEQLSRPAAEALAFRLSEQADVEQRVAEARAELDQARMYLGIARPTIGPDGELVDLGLGGDAIKDAVRLIQTAASRLRMELDQRINVRDLVGIVHRGVDDHMTLEGLDHKDADAGDIIVEILIPEAVRPIDAHASIVPQHQLPERTD